MGGPPAAALFDRSTRTSDEGFWALLKPLVESTEKNKLRVKKMLLKKSLLWQCLKVWLLDLDVEKPIERCCMGLHPNCDGVRLRVKMIYTWSWTHFYSSTMLCKVAKAFFFLGWKKKLCAIPPLARRQKGALRHPADRRWIIVSSAWFISSPGKQDSSQQLFE